MQRTAIVALLQISLCVICGCGRGGITEDQVQDGFAAWNSAQEAMKQNDYAKARDDLTNAIDTGVLSPDQYAEASMQLALCHAQLGDFEKAHQDLDALAQGAANTAKVYAARAAVFYKQGKRPEAVAEMQKARRLNPRVAMPN